MKKTLIFAFILISNTCLAGGVGGGGVLSQFTDSNDMVYSMGNNGEFERVAVGNWISGKWEVRYVDLSNQEKLSTNWQDAIESSKMNQTWVEIK